MEEQEIEYHKYLNRLVVIKNSINIICFTILAIVFNKWWIVFFALLFSTSVGKNKEE